MHQDQSPTSQNKMGKCQDTNKRSIGSFYHKAFSYELFQKYSLNFLDFLGMLTLLFRKKTAVYGIGFLEWNPQPLTLCMRLRFAYSDGICFWFILNRSLKKNHGFLCNSMSQIIILASHLLKPIDSFEFVWVPEIFINSLKRMKTSQHFSFETPSVSLSFYLRLKKAA